MNNTEKHSALYRLLSGNLIFEFNGIDYVVRSPDIDLLQKAQQLFSKTLYQESFNEEWLYPHEIRGLLLRNELITLQQDENLKKIQDTIETTKVNMYENVLNSKELAKLRTVLDAQKKQSNLMFYSLHMLDYLTAEGYANIVKSQFLLTNTIFYGNGNKVFKNDDSADYQLLDALTYEINGRGFGYDELREMSRTEPWRAYWCSQKDGIFGIPASQWNEDQRVICAYSRMYDSVFDSPNCPSDSIVEDDDLLDGWMISQRRENEKNKKEEELEKLLGDNIKGHKEIFLPTKKAGDTEGFTREEIDQFNDPMSRKIKAQREKVINDRGEVKEAELPDIQLERLVQVNR